MTAKHSSGPWETRPIGTKGDIGIYFKGAPASCGVVARVPYTSNKPVVANAQLMAAAPDLLSVLKMIYADVAGPNVTESYLPPETCTAIRLAIKKAEGGAA